MWRARAARVEEGLEDEAVQVVAAKRLDPENIHVGPPDFVAWQKDRRIAFIPIEGTMFGAG